MRRFYPSCPNCFDWKLGMPVSAMPKNKHHPEDCRGRGILRCDHCGGKLRDHEIAVACPRPRAKRKRQPALTRRDHGTEAARRKHKRLGEPYCDRCRDRVMR